MDHPIIPEDENRGPQILIITGVLVITAFLIVSLRVYVRVVILKHLDWDDYIMFLAMVGGRKMVSESH